MAEFKVGGKVICVKDHPDRYYNKFHILKNATKAIREIDNDLDGELMLRFEGTVLPIHPLLKMEFVYQANHFLPLDDFKPVTFTELKTEMPVSAQ